MFLRFTSSALAIGLATAPAAFALTPEEVWTGWTSYYGSMGYTVTEGSRDLAGETLTLKDVVLVSEAKAEAGDKVTITLPQVVLQGAGDGSVRTTASDTIPVRFDTKDNEGKPVGVDVTFSAPGMEIVTSGEGAARTDRTNTPTMTIAVTKVDLADDQTDLTNPGSLTLTDMTSESATQDGKTYTSTGKIGKLAFLADVAETDGSFKADGSVDGLEVNGSLTLPEAGGASLAEDPGAALKAGLAMDGTLKLGATQTKFDFSEPAKDDAPASNGSATSNSAGADLTFKLSSAGIGYQGAATGIDASLTESQLPAPIAYKLDTAAFDVQFPLAQSETPAPFKLSYSLGNLTLADSVWALFDPSSKLPRTPANIDVDLTGLVKINQDLLDPEAAAAAAEPSTDGTATDATSPAMPFEPTEVTINQFSIDAVGAKVSAKGGLKAPEGGTLQTPVGSIDAQMEGVNGLIDALTAMGLVPAEQVQGFRMMLAMFAKPGEGEDTLTSKLEFKEDGSILANGQQIK